MDLKAFRLLLMMALSGVLVVGLAACGDDGGGDDDDDDDDDMMMGDDDDDMMMGDDDDDDDSDFAPFDVIDGFIPDAGGDADTGGTPPGFLDSTATYIGAEQPGTAATDAWWAEWATADGDDECPEGRGSVTVDTDITESTTWTAENCYTITTQIFVSGTEGNPTVLTIEPGTYIEGTGDDTALVITTTGRLEAVGERGNPIIFTSANPPGERDAADWGGLILLGRATLNVGGDGTTNIEGLISGDGSEYGGDDDAHNCGTLEYVRVEFTGFALSDANEINGITFGGCGTGTTVDHVQVFVGGDDGIEIFGGTMNMTHALVFGQADDGFDFDQGWQGAMQFGVSWNFAGERSNEWDNNGDGRNNLPRTTPTVWNSAYIGLNGMGRECFRLREGVGADINNVICQDYSEDQCVEVNHIETGSVVIAGDLTVNDSIMNNCATAFRFRAADSCEENPCNTNEDFPTVNCEGEGEDATCVLETEFVPPFEDAEFNNTIDSDSTISAPETPAGF